MEQDRGEENRLKHQLSALQSGNRSAILGALRDIRYSGSVAVLPGLFELLVEQEDQQITAEITGLLNDLKDQEAAEVLVAAIDNPDYEQIASLLVAACWQNGLSYEPYTDSFVRVAIRGDYATAIEAFTVIEEAAGNLRNEERQRLAGLISDGLEDADEPKRILLRELVRVITMY